MGGESAKIPNAKLNLVVRNFCKDCQFQKICLADYFQCEYQQSIKITRYTVVKLHEANLHTIFTVLMMSLPLLKETDMESDIIWLEDQE